jgi:folate-binding protein YgfZ
VSDPATYGDVTGEYLALREGAGLVAGYHDLLLVTGGDAVDFLDGMLSQSIAELEVGTAARSLLLGPQGKLRAILWVLRGPETIGLLCDTGLGEVVAGDLNRFKLRVDASIEPAGVPVLDIWGPVAAEVVGRLGIEAPATARWLGSGARFAAQLPFQRSSLPRFVLAGYDAEEVTAAGATPVGTLAQTAVRIEAGEPVMGVDLDDGTIPQEGGLVDDAVDFDKGCYLGQELVARIDSRGRVNRHLRGIVIGENVLPPVAAEVHAAERLLGSLTSVGESLTAGAPVALAMLRREAEPGDQIEIRWSGGSTTARVEELPIVP